MPTNKNALIRYKYLDHLLSDHYHHYDINDLTERVNDLLYDAGYPTVTRRCIEKDLVFLSEAPFRAPIKHFKSNGKNCVRYKDTSFSIFTNELSNEERHLLHEVLATLGQFEGLAHFEWLDKFKIGLGFEERRQIISFSNNPNLQNSKLLGTIFDNIANKVVIRITYHKFTASESRSFIVHPYLLKQYNERWFLIAAADDDKKILNFALDRIEHVEPLPEKKYAPCPDDLLERFKNIVGVTLFEDRPVEHILCWVSDASKDYVITKPIHGSYTRIRDVAEEQLRDKYTFLHGGMFFTLDCINNYELIRELCSYGKDLLVLHSSGTVADDVFKRICEMKEKYSEVRT